MRRLNKGKECFFALLFLVLTGLMINFASDVLRPTQTSYGSTWSAFRAEPEDSLDVIYLGSSFAYCDFNPSLVYDASGLTGYVMAGGEQPLSITYWYLKQIFRTQSPSAVVLEGTSRHCFLDREGKFLRMGRDFPELDRTLKELAEPREP